MYFPVFCLLILKIIATVMRVYNTYVKSYLCFIQKHYSKQNNKLVKYGKIKTLIRHLKTHLHIVIDTRSVDCKLQIEGGEVDDVTVPWLQCRVANRGVVAVSKAVRAVRVFRVAVGEVGRLHCSSVIVNGPLTHWKRCKNVRLIFTLQIGANSSLLSEYVQLWHQLVTITEGQRVGIRLDRILLAP